MAAYYHTPGNTTTDLHTLILMNPNFPGGAAAYPDSHSPPPPPSHNVLLLNSAAAAAAFSHPPPPPHNHQFVRLPPQQQDTNTITLYGYPPPEAREVTRPRQELSLSLSPRQNGLPLPEAGGSEGDMVGGGQGSVVGSKYLKAAQELLEEVVHVGDHGVTTAKTTESPNNQLGVGDSPEVKEKTGGCGGGGGGGQLMAADKHDIQMKKTKLITMLDEAEQRYRQYHQQMQIVIASFEEAAGIGSAKTYTSLALKTISKQFRCLKDALQGQIRAANKSLGEEAGGAGGCGGGFDSSAGKTTTTNDGSSRLKFIDQQLRQQRAFQQLGMIQNHNAWRPQRGLPERSVSVLRAWLFEHFLHPYPKDSDKVMLAKQTGLTRSQVSNWFINARVRLWKPMIEEMYMEEIKEQELNGSEDKTSSKETMNDDPAASNSITDQEKFKIVADIHQANKTCKDENNASSSSSLISIPTTSTQNQHGFTLIGSSSSQVEGISQEIGPNKRQRSDHLLNCDDSNNNGEVLIKFGSGKHVRDQNDDFPINISGAMNNNNNNNFGSYPIEELGFFPGNGISLSLGLPPCESHYHHHHHHHHLNLSAAHHHHTAFLSPNHQNIEFRRGSDFSSLSSPSSHPSATAAASFECIDLQNRKGFQAQLLPDYVA